MNFKKIQQLVQCFFFSIFTPEQPQKIYAISDDFEIGLEYIKPLRQCTPYMHLQKFS